MSNEILVPSLGESVTEATVSKWLKQVGEKVDSDEPLVELETDKVNVEVPSPLTGILSSIKVKEGDTVEVGTLLGEVNGEKIESSKIEEIKETNQDEQTYIPPKSNKKKNIKKEKKKIISTKEEILNLTEESENQSSNDALVLDTLVEENKETIEEEKYIPPKTKKNLSPSVRKIAEENINQVWEGYKVVHNWYIRPGMLWLPDKMEMRYKMLVKKCLENRGHNVLD